MKLEETFNRLCNTRHGYLMITVVGVGVLGFFMLTIEIINALIP